jgi:hypothetical protein
VALPTWRAAGAANASLTSAVIALPAGHATDDILLLKTETSGGAIAAPAGYVEVTNSNQLNVTGAITRMQTFWKRDGGSETDPTIVAISNHVIGIIHAFIGCETSGNPWNITAGGNEDTLDNSLSIPGMTTTVADCLIVGVATTETDIGTARYTGEAAANLGSLTKRSDDSTIVGDGGGIGVFTGTLAVAGATGAITATLNANSRKAFMQIALMPPQAGPAGWGPLLSATRNRLVVTR